MVLSGSASEVDAARATVHIRMPLCNLNLSLAYQGRHPGGQQRDRRRRTA